MTYVKIVYGSGGGNTELTCDRVAAMMREEGCNVDLVNAKLAEPKDMTGADLLIIGSPTYGHGLLEKYIEKLLIAAKDLDLKGQRATIIGLGDIKYDSDYFIEAAHILRNWLEDRGAEIVALPLMIAKSPFNHISAIDKWSKNLAQSL